MALSPERKTVLKKEILEEIRKAEKGPGGIQPVSKKPVKEKPQLPKKIIRPKPVLPKVAPTPKPIIEVMSKEEVKAEIKDLLKEDKPPVEKVEPKEMKVEAAKVKEIKEEVDVKKEEIVKAPAKKKPVKKKIVKKTKKKPATKKVVKKAPKPTVKVASVKEIEPVEPKEDSNMPEDSEKGKAIENKESEPKPSKIKSWSESITRPLPKIKEITEPVKTKMGKLYKPKTDLDSKKKPIVLIILLILGIILAALAVDILGMYKFGFDDKYSQVVARTLQLPAGTVNGDNISLSSYLDDLGTIELIAESNGEVVPPSDIKTQLFNRLASVEIMKRELERYGQTVTAEVLDSEMQVVIDQIGSEKIAIEEINRLYGMSLESFKSSVLYPLVAMGILQEEIIADESLEMNQKARLRAEEALNIIRQSGMDFESAVLQYTEDSSAIAQGGDIGWFMKGELPVEIEASLFSLSSGSVYNQVVKDQFGYHIFKVDSKLSNSGTGEESIRLRQIIILVDVEMYIKSLFDNAKIKKYIQ